MRILILGAGKMGSFFCDVLSFSHDVAILDKDPQRLKFVYNVQRFTEFDEVKTFEPEMVINCVSLNRTIEAFEDLIPYLLDENNNPRQNCILSDIASVKNGLKNFYYSSGFRYVSTHPMFGPTFARMDNLSKENAIVIHEEGKTDAEGELFFHSIFNLLRLNISEYSFAQHDELMAYSLSIPFASSLVFGAVMKSQDAPGTTFKKHIDIANGLLSEDDYLLTEILFNKNTSLQLSRIIEKLQQLEEITSKRDAEGMALYLNMVRENLKA